MNRMKSTSEPKIKIKVKIKRYHGCAYWHWNCGEGEEVCGICQSPYEGVCPGVKYPGDECPVVWGKCQHAFHLQCISTWLEKQQSQFLAQAQQQEDISNFKGTCPICRQVWEFRANANNDDSDQDETED